jgi:Ras-related protein Rab-8A
MEEGKIDLTVIKLGILGDSSVGKTCLCNSFMNLEFSMDQLSTIGADKSEKKLTLKNGKDIKLIIWDTAGQERFRSAGLKYARNAQGIVLVFDVTNRASFDNIGNWMELINENFKNPSIILFGNKADIAKEKWKVSNEEAKEFAEKMKFPYFETSAMTKQGINEGFSFIANDIYDKLKGKEDDNIQIGKHKEDDYEIVNGCFGKKKRLKKKVKNAK